MIEVRWHGRGGQGAVTAAEILAHAAINEGKYAQAFPSFGPERRGAPVVAFNRFDEKPIWTRSDVYEPDVVVVLDPTLLKNVNVVEGLKSNGSVILNTSKKPGEVKEKYGFKFRTATVNATRIALDVIGIPVVNTAMLGAFLKATNILKLDSVLEAVKERFTGKIGEKNVEAVIRAYKETVLVGE
jgi:2-oxoacid:acceptor oxidoreductase gamma subunit (pyruvate/2-ketoisovalerate family)